jgi:hypothetical protein
MPIMGRTIVTLTVLAVALIAINAQALAQLVDVPPEVIRALNVQFGLINKRTPIWINPQLKITEVSRNGETIFFSMETTLPRDQWTQEMRDRASQETTKGLCSDKDVRVLLGYAFQTRYVITDRSGRYVTGFFGSKDQCLTTEN